MFSPETSKLWSKSETPAGSRHMERPQCHHASQSVSQSTNDSHYSAQLFTDSDRHPIHPVHSVPSRPASVVQRKRSGHSGAVPPGPTDASKSRSKELGTSRYIGRPSVCPSVCPTVAPFIHSRTFQFMNYVLNDGDLLRRRRHFFFSELGPATLEAD